jgi:HD superfamily phosphohydrolase
VPFGHTFEKEAQLFDEDEWQDKNRHDLLLGQTSNLADCFRAFFETRNLSHEAADQLREDISLVLRTKRSDVATLPYPFVHDLVGNTICADLVDYVRRDMYYCGLNETYGDRFLKYLAVFPVRPVPPSGKHSPGLRPVRVRESKTFETRPTEAESEFCRVVLMGYRYNERHLAVSKPDVFGEAIDLVRRRLAVAQKLYFHRTKIAASAMLAEAAVSAGFKSAMEIWDKSDAEVLKWLKESKDPGAARLASRIIERKLYKPIYRVSYHPDDESPAGDAVWKAYERFVKPKERHQLALRLQELIGRALFDSPNNAPGAVVVSCPDHRMGLKAFDMLVMPQPTSEVRSLQMSEHRPTQHEIMAIQEKHENLWRLEVFVDPEIIPIDIADVFVRELAGAIQHEIGPRNEVSECATLPGIDLADLERRTLLKTKLKKHDPEKKITQAQLERLDELVMRSWKSEDEFEKAFVDFMVDNSDNGMTK